MRRSSNIASLLSTAIVAISFATIATIATAASAIETPTLEIRDRVVAEDGVVSFEVFVPEDSSLVEMGRAEVVKIDVAAPEFVSFAYENDVLVERTRVVSEVSCAYAGYTPSSIVSLVSCGPSGPTLAFTFPDGTTYRARKSDGDHANVEGAYAVEVFAGDETTNGTATSVDGTRGSLARTVDAQMDPPTLDPSFVQAVRDAAASGTAGSLSKKRRRLLQEPTQRVTFDYVFVSDHKRYLNYDGDEGAIVADAVAEIAAANAIYLVGDRFTPQIQFRMTKHIVWTTGLPSVVTQTNVESGSYDASGRPQNLIDLNLYLRDFGKYAFHVSEYDLVTKQAVTGDMATTGDGAHGWHLLTGNFGGLVGGQMAAGLAMTNTTCYTFPDDYRTGCETLMSVDDIAYESFYLGQATASDATGYCLPNLNYGLTSTLNTPGHYFPGLILAHELGHNLGFMHVYNGGDEAGDVDGCLVDHGGEAVMGYVSTSMNVTWSQCSVNKFQSQWASAVDHFGFATGEGGMYSCAANNFDATKLAATTNPFSAFSAQEMYHHLESPPPSSTPAGTNPSPPPSGATSPTPAVASDPPPPSNPTNPSPPPTAPSPPVPPVPAGHAALAYKLTIATTLSEHQKAVLRQAISQNNGVHGVA